MRFNRFLLSVLVCGLYVSVAGAEIIHVYEDGTGDAPTIQAGLDMAEEFDTVLVGPGVYYEHDIVGKPYVLLLSEAGPFRTVIDATGGFLGISGYEDAPLVVEGFTVHGAEAGGLDFQVGGPQLVSECIVYECGGGIYGREWTGGTVRNLTVVFNTTATGWSGSGLSFSSAPVTIENCISAFNEGYGVVSWQGPSPDLACCDIFANSGGVYYGMSDPIGQNGNIIKNPRFCDTGLRNFHLQKTSPCRPFSPPNPYCDLIGALPVGCPLAHAVVDLNGALPAWEPRAVVLSASPNPCRVQTTVWVSTRDAAATVVRIVDPAGRLVRSLRADAPSSGAAELLWDTTDASGRKVGSGVYYAVVRSGSETHRRSIVVLR